MDKRQLGNTDLYLSEMGYGCASIWGKSFFPEEQSIKLFEEAFKGGISFFDTGFSYDNAEERLGKCLQQIGNDKRKELIIASKCGTRINEHGKYYHDWSVDWMKRSVDISLNRLHTDYLDMLHLHGPTISEITDEVVRFMRGLKEQGVVRAIGVNSFDTDVLTYICKNKLFDFVMLDYNVMRQDREPLINEMNKNGIGIIAGAALAQSLYSNRVFKIKGKKDIWYLLRALKNFRGHMKDGLAYRFMNNVPGFTGNQLALKYVLDNPCITSAVFGTTSVEHLLENIKPCDLEMPNNIRKQIKHVAVKTNISPKKLDRK
mgnify:CR=1 FL=1